MKAVSLKGSSTEEISNALTESMADGFKPTLAIVFLSVKQDREAISKLLSDNGIQIFGATTAGEFVDGEIETGSIVMMLLDLNPAYFKIEFRTTTQETTFEDAKKIGTIGKQTFANPAFIIANSGVSLDGEPIVEGIAHVFRNLPALADREVTIFGGKAGDDLALEATYVFTNGNERHRILWLASYWHHKNGHEKRRKYCIYH